MVPSISNSDMSSLISCDAILNRSKIPVPRGTSILLLFFVKNRQNLAKIHEDRTKTASQLINELTSGNILRANPANCRDSILLRCTYVAIGLRAVALARWPDAHAELRGKGINAVR